MCADFSPSALYYHCASQPKIVERQQTSGLGSSELANSSPMWAAEAAEPETCFHKELSRWRHQDAVFNMLYLLSLVNFMRIIASVSFLVSGEKSLFTTSLKPGSTFMV